MKTERANGRELERRAGEAAALLSLMANDKRLMILCRLLRGEQSVGELAAALGSRPSTVSQHLALLRSRGLVDLRCDAQKRFYVLADTKARGMLRTLEKLFCAPAEGSTHARTAN